MNNEKEKQIIIYEEELARTKRELELAAKGKEQKDKHVCLLVKEKDKLLRKIENASEEGKERPATGKPCKGRTSLKENKENSLLVRGAIEGDSGRLEGKEPISSDPHAKALRKRVCVLEQRVESLEKELESSKKENFNLMNRLRNKTLK